MAGNAVVLHRVRQQPGPAAADIEHLLAGLEPKLAADMVELVLLDRGLVAILVPVVKISAGIAALRIEEGVVELVGDIVVEADVFFVLRRIAGRRLVVGNGFERPRPAARHEQEAPRDLEGEPPVHLLSDFPGSHARAALDHVEHRAVLDVDPRRDPQIQQRVEIRFAHQARDRPFVGDRNGERVARVVRRHPRAVPKREAEVELQAPMHVGKQSLQAVETLLRGGHAASFGLNDKDRRASAAGPTGRAGAWMPASETGTPRRAPARSSRPRTTSGTSAH